MCENHRILNLLDNRHRRKEYSLSIAHQYHRAKQKFHGGRFRMPTKPLQSLREKLAAKKSLHTHKMLYYYSSFSTFSFIYHMIIPTPCLAASLRPRIDSLTNTHDTVHFRHPSFYLLSDCDTAKLDVCISVRPPIYLSQLLHTHRMPPSTSFSLLHT
jgi:hypothetical protein